MIGYQRKLDRVLDAMGGLYTQDDIFTAIGEGKMQSFAVNNSWAVTEVGQFPRARKLNIVAVVGDLPDMEALQMKLLAYADQVNAGLISAYGRHGWIPTAEALGWRLKAKNYLYHREM